jgi:hypothetical protein
MDKLGRWMAKLGRWVAMLGRLVAKLGKWVTKLVACLLATAYLALNFQKILILISIFSSQYWNMGSKTM